MNEVTVLSRKDRAERAALAGGNAAQSRADMFRWMKRHNAIMRNHRKARNSVR